MKVTTDACLFGAITAAQFIRKSDKRLLDIGTGTGLLSLMVAQKNEGVQIDCAEIEHAAAAQATSNIKSSSFANQVNTFHTDIKQHVTDVLYDFIFTNPPFFENDLKSDKVNRNKALHDASLTLVDLMQQIDRLLKTDGAFCILLAFHRTKYFIDLALKTGWVCNRNISVKQTEKHEAFRSILLFERKYTTTENTCIIIKQNGSYSDEFSKLLKDYYLNL